MKISKDDLYMLEQLHFMFEHQHCVHVHTLATIIPLISKNELDK